MSDSIAPALLIAMPQLQDPNFRRSVVLLIHHDEEGTFGLVVSRVADITAEDLCATLEIDWRGGAEQLVGWGGPVQPNTGWVLFGEGPEDPGDASQVTDGIHFAGSLDTLRAIAQSPPERFRLFLGYAGWGPGQLEHELAQGSWLLAPVSSHMIFDVAEEAMWERVLRDLGIDPVTLIATPGVH